MKWVIVRASTCWTWKTQLPGLKFWKFWKSHYCREMVCMYWTNDRCLQLNLGLCISHSELDCLICISVGMFQVIFVSSIYFSVVLIQFVFLFSNSLTKEIGRIFTVNNKFAKADTIFQWNDYFWCMLLLINA